MAGIIFCDLENNLESDILLSHYGVKGTAKILFEFYFQNTYQRVQFINSYLNLTLSRKEPKLDMGCCRVQHWAHCFF